MKAMVLAAGVGSRLEPLTSQVPKPLVPVANRPVMEHIIRLLAQHGFTDICANLHYLPEKLIEYFGDGSKHGVKLHFTHEEKLSGDAGGVRTCREFLQDDTFIVIMGDLITDADLTAIIKQHKDKKALATIGIKAVEDVTRFGVVVTDENGFITGFQEKPKKEDALSDFISTGIYVLEPEVFNHIPATGEYGFGRQLFPKLVQDKLPVLGVKIDGYWSDVGTIQQYRESNVDALSGMVIVNLPGKKIQNNDATIWQEPSAKIDEDCYVYGLAMLGKNSHVHSGTRFGGTVVVGDNVIIESGARIVDSIIWSNSHIGANAEITNSVIGLNCRIESGSKLMEVTEVSEVSESETPSLAANSP